MTNASNNIRIANSEIAFSHIGHFPNRPTVVFLHDSLGCMALWRDFPQKLAALSKCNILVYDRHGYGASGEFVYPQRAIDYLEDEADVLSELIETLHIQQPILFGHSDGGSIALIAAAKFPQKINAVITEGAHIFVEAETVKGIRDAIEQYQETDLREKLEKYHGAKTNAMFNAWTQTWTSDAFQSWNIEHFLPSIQCPVMVIQGENDEFGTMAQVSGIVNQVSGKAEKQVLPGIGHTPHKESPELVLKIAADFIHSIATDNATSEATA